MLLRKLLLIFLWLLPLAAHAGIDEIIPIDSTNVSFSLLHRGDRIGSHVVKIKKTGRQLQVEHHLDVVYSVGFITLYELHHKSTEVWEDADGTDPRLIQIASETNENDTFHYVRGYADSSEFKIESSSGSSATTGNVTTTNSLWNVYWARKSSDYPEMLDSIDGSLMVTSIEPAGQTRLQGVSTEKYVVKTDSSRAESWFAENYLLKALLRRGGFEVGYERTSLASNQ